MYLGSQQAYYLSTATKPTLPRQSSQVFGAQIGQEFQPSDNYCVDWIPLPESKPRYSASGVTYYKIVNLRHTYYK